MTRFSVFDAHFHIIDPKFPITPNQNFSPQPFSIDDYHKATQNLNIVGGAVVSGSFQAYDQTYLIEALKHLGPNFVGVTQLPHNVSDEALIRLHSYGIRAIRFNLKRGGSEDIKHLKNLAHRVFDLLGWHVALYVDSQQLDDLYDVLISIPKVSIDHLGLSQVGFKTLLKLVEKDIKIKASGFGRVDFNVKKAIKQINRINPNTLMFGSDLPSTRAPRPFHDDDILLIQDALDQESTERVLCRNAQNFYRPIL